MRNTVLLSPVAAMALAAPLPAQTAAPQPVITDVDAPVKAVTVYRSRASIDRRASLALAPGLHELRFLLLPESIQSQSLQARVSGGPKVLEVQFEQVSMADVSTPETEQIDHLIDDLEGRLDTLARKYEVIELQEDFLSKVGVRVANDATDAGGTAHLDLEVVRKQLAFVTDERLKLIDQRGELDAQKKKLQAELDAARDRRHAIAGDDNIMRLAVVTVAAPETADATIDLTYLVTDAAWEPAYSIRAAADESIVDIEYDAMLTQRTGENWNDVELTLSTARPMLAANPPMLDPWFVDLQRDVAAPRAAAARRDAALDRQESAGKQIVEQLKGLAADAEVAGEGPSVTYRLARPVTVRTNVAEQQRTRIANIQSGGDFVYVAVPRLTEDVYIRGELTNHSEYTLLPGPVSIFYGQDFVGPTQIESVAPGQSFEMYFGVDPNVKASQTLIEKKTSKTGLLGGGLKTEYSYRVQVDNGTGKGLLLELWDRYPVSRSDQITIELVDLSHALATDPEYVEQQKPLGLLKWSLGIPANATAGSLFVITYGVRINRAKNVEMTPLPD